LVALSVVSTEQLWAGLTAALKVVREADSKVDVMDANSAA